MRKINFADHLEESVAKALDESGIVFVHESEGAALDFYLSDYNTHIEIKQYASARTEKQLAKNEEVILLQGKQAVKTFISLITNKHAL